KTSLSRGEWLTGPVAPQDRGEWYWGQVRREWHDDGGYHWEDVLGFSFDADSHFSIPTALLPAGDYFLAIGADSVGWDGNESRVPFTLSDDGFEPQTKLYFTGSEILTGQDVTFFAYAPGADWFEVNMTRADDPGWWNHRDSGGEYRDFDWSCSDAGVYTFTLTAWRDGEVIGEDSFDLTVAAPYGDLFLAGTQNIPGVIGTNTAVHGSFTADENATDYEIRLTWCPEDSEWFTVYVKFRNPAWGDETYLTDLDFPAEFFSRPGFYELEIHAYTTGWNTAHLKQRILVTENMEQNLTLTVNGGSDEPVYLHQVLPLTITVPENVTAVRVYSSLRGDWEYSDRDRTRNTMEWDWGFHHGGDDMLIAQASTDTSVTEWLEDPSHDGMRDFDWSQVSWTMASEPVTVPVIQYGVLESPLVEFPGGQTVQRGDMLELIIHPVENAYGYGIQIRRTDDWYWFVDMECPLSETTAVRVPTDALEPGDYVLQIDPRRYGWDGRSDGYSLTVTEPDSWTDDPVFRVSATEMLTREYLTYSIYAPGAAQVKLCNESVDNEINSSWGESLTSCVSLNWRRVYRLQAYAYYPGEEGAEDEWLLIGEADIDVTAPYGSMEITAQVPETVRASDPVTFTLLCDFKGTDGYAEYHFLSLDSGEYDLQITETPLENGILQVTGRVDADTLEIGPYFLTAYLFPGAPGYETLIYRAKIDVTAGTLNATLTAVPNPMQIFEDLSLQLNAPGATAVALYGTMNGMDWIYAEGDSLQEAQTAWMDGEELFYGLYTTQAIDPEREGFSWEDVRWEGMSNSVLLTIEPPTGELEELNISLEQSSVKRGDLLKVSILNENPGLDVSYGAAVQPSGEEEDGSEYPWFSPDPDDPKTIWIDTLELEPGDYRLLVSANALGCYPVDTRIPFTVTEADAGPHMRVSAESAATGDMIRVTGFVNDAVRLRLNVSFENETWDPEPAFFEAEGSFLTAEVFTGEHPDVLILDLTAFYEDGTSETARETVEVTAPNGLLPAPAIRLNSAWAAGGDLDFTVNAAVDSAQYLVLVGQHGAEEADFAEFVPRGTPEKRFCLSSADYGFTAGKLYEISVISFAPGYDGNEASRFVTPRKASLKTMTLPAKVKVIPTESFAYVAAEKFVLPAGVTTIESNAFTGCSKLVELDLPAGITSFAADALGTSGPVFVFGEPGSYLEAYAAAVNNLYFIPID
ncbi:MAG: leucine-rich repeat protein, partial [Oscillospiraceae bacterium]|nr:leucine-rich repeat protein [Oscillospiraceae bacterium]